MAKSEVLQYYDTAVYRKNGIEPIENTAEEILDLAVEMDERIDGKWKPKKDDEPLQKRFKDLLKDDPVCSKAKTRIGAEFLRKNRKLFDD
jgi:hypothetical protein